jgi:hypothetical protein
VTTAEVIPIPRREWQVAVAAVPIGAAGKLVVSNLALQANAAGVIRKVRYFPVAAQTCLPVGAVHDVVGDLSSRGWLAWNGSAETGLRLTRPAAAGPT